MITDTCQNYVCNWIFFFFFFSQAIQFTLFADYFLTFCEKADDGRRRRKFTRLTWRVAEKKRSRVGEAIQFQSPHLPYLLTASSFSLTCDAEICCCCGRSSLATYLPSTQAARQHPMIDDEISAIDRHTQEIAGCWLLSDKRQRTKISLQFHTTIKSHTRGIGRQLAGPFGGGLPLNWSNIFILTVSNVYFSSTLIHSWIGFCASMLNKYVDLLIRHRARARRLLNFSSDAS